MIISEVTSPNQLKANSKKPKLIKPNKGNESPHPMRGKLVGEADEPNKNASSRERLNRSLVAQGHQVQKDKKKEFKKGAVKHKGKPLDLGEGTLVFHKESELRGMLDTLLQSWKGQDHTPDEFKALVNALGYTFKKVTSGTGEKIELVKAVQGAVQSPDPEKSVDEAKGDIRKGLGALAIAASLYGVGSLSPSAEDTPLGKELAAAAKAGDEVAAYHLDSLDLYVDENMQRTLVNLRIAYLEDSPRKDVKAYLSDPKRFPGVRDDSQAGGGQSILQQINWNK